MIGGFAYQRFIHNPQPIISVCKFKLGRSFDEALTCFLVGLWIKYLRSDSINSDIEFVTISFLIILIDKIDFPKSYMGNFLY
jgi:hypothetical protein